MARLNRLVVAGLAHHVIQRAVAAGRAFINPADCELFLQALRRSCTEHGGVEVHAYALVESEFQLLLTPTVGSNLGRMMQALARFYVPAFNQRHGRAGALWQGRYRAAPVGGAETLLTCMLYVEQLPRRGGWAGSLAEFDGSSAAHHTGRRADPLLARVPAGSAYWQLGNTPFERDAAYRVLLDQPLSAAQVAAVEASTPKGWALGPGEFLAGLGQATDRRVAIGRRGRPRIST